MPIGGFEAKRSQPRRDQQPIHLGPERVLLRPLGVGIADAARSPAETTANYGPPEPGSEARLGLECERLLL